MTTEPLPQAGGAWVREPDGTLRQETEATPAPRPAPRPQTGRKAAVEGAVQAPVKEA